MTGNKTLANGIISRQDNSKDEKPTSVIPSSVDKIVVPEVFYPADRYMDKIVQWSWKREQRRRMKKCKMML